MPAFPRTVCDWPLAVRPASAARRSTIHFVRIVKERTPSACADPLCYWCGRGDSNAYETVSETAMYADSITAALCISILLHSCNYLARRDKKPDRLYVSGFG